MWLRDNVNNPALDTITFIDWFLSCRYTDKHDCSFDYKAMGEKEISEANPVIVAAKLNKI